MQAREFTGGPHQAEIDSKGRPYWGENFKPVSVTIDDI